MDWLKEAMAGVEEEQVAIKTEKRKERIFNCGKPYDYYNKIDREWKVAHQFCKDWTCDYCNRRRATEEQARQERALSEYGEVKVIRDLPESQWPKLGRQFDKVNTTKEMYRRLPQDNGTVTVFFVGSPSLETLQDYKVEVISTVQEQDERETEKDNPRSWFNLARKRPGKRTSGNLGVEIKPIQTGPEQTSVKIDVVRGYGVTWVDKLAAMNRAEAAVKDIEPQDKEHLEELIKQTADIYEKALQEMGYKTHRVRLYRKMDLSSLTSTNQQQSSLVDIKSTSDWYQQAFAGLKEELAFSSKHFLVQNHHKPIEKFKVGNT